MQTEHRVISEKYIKIHWISRFEGKQKEKSERERE